ncbi:MAG TPA: methyltransferase domain-containing protein [Burkholderiaceae bacterium]|jgi:malonyl-CoA O-methyltransferase|nr:methyltransferase domain-containing protein [Burkholderiaceae bacterium]
MYERLVLVRLEPKRLLDVGCGEGADLDMLQKQYGNAHVIGVDASLAMLTATRGGKNGQTIVDRLLTKWIPGKTQKEAEGPSLLCADFAQLPFGDMAVDLIWSNLALHWHPEPARVFKEWRRVINIDGLLMFSCLGPDTFKEVREAFSVVDGDAHALSFVDMHEFGDMMVTAAFSAPVMDMETLTVTYDTVDKLMADVRAYGGNPLTTRRRGLLGRQAWGRVREALEAMRRPEDGKIPLTVEIIYGHAFRPPNYTMTDIIRKKESEKA